MATVHGTNLVEMALRFIPTIDFCGVSVHFVDGSSIFMCSCHNGYCLYDKNEETIFKTNEELAQKAQEYFAKHEIDDIKISGFSLLKE